MKDYEVRDMFTWQVLTTVKADDIHEAFRGIPVQKPEQLGQMLIVDGDDWYGIMRSGDVYVIK